MKKNILLLLIAFTARITLAQDSTWSLQECIDYGLANNIYLKQTIVSNEQYRIDLAQAKANRVPTVNGSASHSYSFGRSIDPFSNQFVTRNIQSNNFSINGNITLFHGFQNRNQIRQSRLDYQAGEQDVAVAQNNLILDIAQAYYQILLANEQIVNAKTQIESTEAQVANMKKLVEAGRVAEINLLQVQSQLASDQLTLTNAENQFYLSKVTMMQLLDLPLDNTFIIETPGEEVLTVAPEKRSTTEIFTQSLEVQPSIKSLSIRKESSLVGLRIAQGGKLPRLSLNGNIFTGYSSARSLTTVQTQVIETDIGYLQSDPTQIVSSLIPVSSSIREDYPFARQLNDNLGQSVGLSLSVPILNNRVARSNIQRAKLSMQIAELEERNGKSILRKNIEQAYADMKAAEKMYATSENALNLTEQSYKNSERRFSLGMISPADLLIEKNNYFRAKSDYSQAKYQYILKTRILEFYASNQL